MLIALLLFAAAVLAAAAFGRSLRHTFPLAVVLAALGVYGCTCLNHKSLAYPLLGLALAALAALAVWRGRQKRLAPPPAGQALLYLGLLLVLFAATRAWVPAFVDDRTHWAVFATQMVAVERFPTGVQSCSAFSDYPPLTGLFLAFLQPGGRPADVGLFYFGQRLLYMALALPAMSAWPRGKSRPHRALAALGQAVFVLFVPALFSREAVYALAPDALMGFLAAWALIAAWRMGERGANGFDRLQLLAALTALPLCKQTGVLFALAAALCATLLLARRQKAWQTALLWLAPAAAWGSWQAMCRLRGLGSYLTEDARAAFTPANLAGWLLHPAAWAGTLAAYLRTLALEPLNGGLLGLSALGFLLALGLLAWRVARRRPEWARPLRRVGLALLAAAALFAAGLCFSYLFLFQDWEREIFSAYARYLGPFFAAAGLWLLYLASRAGLFAAPRRADRLAALCLLALALTLNWADGALLLPGVYSARQGAHQQAQRQARENLGTLPEHLRACDPQEAPILLLALNEPLYTANGDYYRYLLAPARIDPVYRSDFAADDPGGYGAALGDRIERRAYNWFYAAPDAAPWLPYAGKADDAGAPLEAGALYTLQNDFLHRME